MKSPSLLAAAAIVAVPLLFCTAALGQGQPQTVELVKVDVVRVSTGFRASSVIGSAVINSAGETVGKIDEVIISADGKAPYAILSVGGFLGMGTRLVAVPYDALRFADNKVMLPGATKEGLQNLPEFKYSKE
ncbi:MAG: PRC-barrel domain-containing protein [Rhodospirillales bacterium]|nr:MAG: PRC-barrel domain-containing protein [Rhodospirillales bacterium]